MLQIKDKFKIFVINIIIGIICEVTPSVVLGTQWFLIEIDGNHRGMDGDCREIDLIRGSHPP